MSKDRNLSSSTQAILGAAALVVATTVCPQTAFCADRGEAASLSAAAPSVGFAPTADGGSYDLTPEQIGDCVAGAECVVKLTATTKGEYHVNDTYPFKLTLSVAGVEFHGSAGATFAGADFERRGKTVGVMTIKFKPAAKGALTLTGKYKVCFCTDQVCAPSTIDVSIPVTVK